MRGRTRGWWLVELELDGRWYRWSTEAITVETAAGDVLEYSPGLAPLELAQGDEETAVEIVDPTVDWPAVAVFAEGARTQVLRWLEGTVYETAEVYAVGRAAELEYGAPEESVVWSVRTDALMLGRQLPDALARVDASTWPITALYTTPQNSAGSVYPIVFGYPGDDGAAVPQAVMPVVQAQWGASEALSYIVVCEDPDATVTSLRLRDEQTSATDDEPCSVVADLLGRRVKVAEAGTVTAGAVDTTIKLYVGFKASNGGGPVRSAYDVLVYLLRRFASDTQIDWAKLAEIEDVIGPYQVDTWINEVVESPWDWLEDVLLPDLPVRVATSTRGRYLVPLVYRTDPQRVVRILSVDDEEAVRESPVKTSWGAVNEFVAYYRRLSTGTWKSRVVLTSSADRLPSLPALSSPAESATEPVTVIGSGLCLSSQSRYGVRQGEAMEIDWTWDAATVARVLGWQAERDALPARTVTYLVEEGDRIREGDQVEVTDTEVGIDEEIGIVAEPPFVSDDGVRIALRFPGL